MRILLTTDTIGGVWTFTEELARGLLEAGNIVALVSFGRLPSAAQQHAVQGLDCRFGESFRYVASDAPLEWMENNHQTWKAGIEALLPVISSFAPDVLHSSQFCFGRLQSVLPVLITAHSDVLSWGEFVLGPHRLKQTASPDWLRQYLQLVQDGLRQAARVVAPTEWMSQTLAQLYPLRSSPAIIANGISPVPAHNAERKLQAVTAGRLWDQAKGMAVLTGIELPLSVYVAGEGSGEQGSASPDLVCLGPLPRPELLRLFAESAIYLATSLYEPFGLAPLEAALCGCAIVARDLQSFREIWGDAALYFTSPATLLGILTSLTAVPRRLKGAQCRSRRRAARYSAAAMAQQYQGLYAEILTATAHSQEFALAHA